MPLCTRGIDRETISTTIHYRVRRASSPGFLEVTHQFIFQFLLARIDAFISSQAQCQDPMQADNLFGDFVTLLAGAKIWNRLEGWS